MQSISEKVKRQREFFRTNATKSPAFRREQLGKLKQAITKAEPKILEALHKDMRKPELEAFASEIAFAYEEIQFAMKHLADWMKPESVPTPLIYSIGKSHILSEPLGVVLIIGPWNYPFQLIMAPLVGAIAAGNAAMIKPSEMAPNTSAIIKKILSETFEPDYIDVVEGGVETSTALLAEKWDHIFYTGSTAVGKIVMTAASKYLTPVTLELGGKSPCIVDNDVPLDVVARRIIWGKFFNAGQTCVAPDYILAPTKLRESLVEHFKKAVTEFFGDDPAKSPDYARIINRKHFDRLKNLLDPSRVILGGKTQESDLYISPTLLGPMKFSDKIMEDEIFGPLLPILDYDNLDDALSWISEHPRPLALYYFSQNKENQEKVLERTSFGGGCINDTLIHLSNPHLPFGGVGSSGIGAYHGKYSFDTFSHKKSVVRRSFLVDPKIRYPPYGKKLSLIRKLIAH